MDRLLLWDKRYNCKKFENEADFGVSESTPLLCPKGVLFYNYFFNSKYVK